MSDDLPIDMEIGDEQPGGDGGDEGWGVLEWLLAAGGVVVAIYILAYVLNLLVWLTGYALQAAVVVALLYGGYKGLEYLLGGDEASGANTMPDTTAAGELDDLSDGGELEGELEGLDELDEAGTEDVTLGDLSEDDLEADVEASADLEDDELEKKFADLEREMSDD